MEANKWYKKLSNGKYWLLSAYTGVLKSTFVSPGHDVVDFYNTDFDPTPHTRTTFPNMPNLIERVSKIDPAAAEWLEFGDHSDIVFCTETSHFDAVFMWCTSPQGTQYWQNIDRLLNKQDEQRSTPMQKEYEYKATEHASITPSKIAKYNPCSSDFGEAVKWYYRSGADEVYDSVVVSKLVQDKRFSWLNWLSENTPFVKRTEKKAFRFGPENLRIVYREGGNAVIEIRGTETPTWWSVINLVPNMEASIIGSCGNLPVQMDGDKIAIK